MSSAEDVRDAWTAAIWQDTTITDYTTKIFQYEITSQSEAEKQLLSEGGKLNFIEVVTSRYPTTKELGGGSSALIRFDVEVRYTVEKLPPGAALDGGNFTLVQDFFDDLFTLIESDLSNSWSSTVDYWEMTSPPNISSEEIGSRECWRGVTRFAGFQYTTI